MPHLLAGRRPGSSLAEHGCLRTATVVIPRSQVLLNGNYQVSPAALLASAEAQANQQCGLATALQGCGNHLKAIKVSPKPCSSQNTALRGAPLPKVQHVRVSLGLNPFISRALSSRHPVGPSDCKPAALSRVELQHRALLVTCIQEI